jgi:hypothetical protein
MLFVQHRQQPGFPHRFAEIPCRPICTATTTTASDHLPVFMVFANPFNPPFRLLAIGRTNQIVSLQWESASNRSYNIEVSSNLTAWTPLATNLTATGANFTFTTNVPDEREILPRLSRAVSAVSRNPDQGRVIGDAFVVL